MTARAGAAVGAALWLGLGIAVWNGFFDLYISRGAREYLQLAAEARLGQGPTPSMSAVMAQARHAGVVAASTWAAIVVLAGWITMAVVGRGRA